MSIPGIQIEKVTKRFGNVAALDQISLEIRPGEFFSLLGPSGCGKTTLLRIISGLESSDSGELRISGREMAGVPPQARPVNTVFQNYALFPHLSVWDNVAFGLRMKKTPAVEIIDRVRRTVKLVHIDGLEERYPNQLSGGQKQRVALARALVNEPAVLLLDEPLAAIDAKLRAQLQSELKSLQRQLGTTFVYVTHDQNEALSLSDRLAVMQSGRIEQLGSPKEIYERPSNRFVASFVGACNLLEARVNSENPQTAETRLGALHLPKACRALTAIGIRQEKVRLISAAGQENTFAGTIQDVVFNGAQTTCSIAVGGSTLRAEASSADAEHRAGERVIVQLPAEALLLFEE